MIELRKEEYFTFPVTLLVYDVFISYLHTTFVLIFHMILGSTFAQMFVGVQSGHL